ncbi:hypothetical protein QQZ08_008219 [Neonectria magnoliae]|uniref:Heterokaryon incompatibility domain-containing protein n=1 Tax=Neonectria magnoliae TaxID=2732573 RepID=A0ABR1HVV4_9HYPO
MKAQLVPFHDIASLPAITPNDANHVDIFDALIIDGCLLDCQAWRMKHNVAYQRTTTQGEKRDKRHELKAIGKTSVLNQRQSLQSNKRHLNSQLKFKREQFKMQDLERSSEKGCECCRVFQVLLDALLSTQPDLVREELAFEWVGYSLFLKLSHSQSDQSLSFQLFVPSGIKTRVQGLRSANLIIGDTSSVTSFEKAREWIKECETSHGQCGEGRNVPLPKRLLDLKVRNNQSHQISLAETEGTTGTYACLSHCWGKDKMPVITTEYSLKHHLKGILLSSLPKTFRDAIKIARRLGLRYLWIDSLCIVQDSVKDWEIESSKMADIYRQSFITIAATSSSDFRGGCFSPEGKEDLCFQIDVGGINTAIAMRECNGEGPVMEMVQFERTFPLFTRAWVYQERMLSRRMLYCNHRELQFECRQETTCECGNRFMPPHAMPKTEASQGMLQGKDQYAEPEKFDGTKGKFSARQLTQHWQRTVTQYTKLGLTKADDKLPALSGCAKDIGRLTGDRYLAGIWRASFAEGMLWTVRPPVNLPRPSPRAPSWSWVSVDTTAGIDYTYALETRHRQAFQDKIREVDCVLAGRDTTGSVKSGFVRLQTSLCPAHLRRICRRCMTSRSRVVYTVEYDRWLSTRYSDITPCTFNVQGLDLGSFRPSCFPDFKYDDRSDFDFANAENSGACKLAEIFLLHLYDGQSFNSAVITDFFLMLRKCKGLGADTYERVAMVTIQFPR